MTIRSLSDILVATRNRGKVREIARLLQGLPVALRSLDDFPSLPDCPEDGLTFRENSAQKADHYFRLTGLPTLADDSGLCVEALQGQPGVHSARYAGDHASDQDRIVKLLRALHAVADSNRRATFVCAVSFRWAEDEILTWEGQVEGVILPHPKGQDGFGYDPVFYVPEEQATFAELPIEIKNRISHRGKALALFRRFLAEKAGFPE